MTIRPLHLEINSEVFYVNIFGFILQEQRTPQIRRAFHERRIKHQAPPSAFPIKSATFSGPSFPLATPSLYTWCIIIGHAHSSSKVTSISFRHLLEACPRLSEDGMRCCLTDWLFNYYWAMSSEEINQQMTSWYRSTDCGAPHSAKFVFRMLFKCT